MSQSALKTTPVGKGLRTAAQSAVGALVGLGAVVWAVPGVPEAVTGYVKNNVIQILVLVAVPSGAVAFAQNKANK